MSDRGLEFPKYRGDFVHYSDCPYRNHSTYHCICQDTAPFDVAAFNAILDGGGTDSAAEHYADEGHGAIKHYCSEHCDFNDGSDWDDANNDDTAHRTADDLRTHYYGDDCPGGHYDDKPTCPNDGFWCDEHNDYCFDSTKYNND